MPQLIVYPQSDFPDIYKWQALAFMRCEWPSIFQGDILYLDNPYPADLNPVHFVMAEGETLLSYATLLKQPLTHAGQEYTVYGFGNMLTFPPYRKQGYGRQVLHSATTFAQQGDADIAILYCDPNLEPYYASEGWIATRSETRIGQPETFEVYKPLRMMLFVSSKGKASQVAFEELPVYVGWTW